MPFAKIHVLEGRYEEARLNRVSNAVQQGLISALGDSDGRFLPDHPHLTAEPKSQRARG